MKDILGVTVQVGDTVAYGMRVGNSGALAVGEVLEVRTKKDRYTGREYEEAVVRVSVGRWGHEGTRPSLWADPDRMVVVKKARSKREPRPAH
jgi:hypothetical protein